MKKITKTLKINFFLRTCLAKMVQRMRIFKYRFLGYDIDPTVIIERKVNLDRLYPHGIHIKKNSLIASGVTILSHDHCKRTGKGILSPLLLDTIIGERCFIAVNALILPGVEIGDECIVGAGAVVTKNVDSHCIVVGNPAQVIRRNIHMNERAEILNWNIKEGWFDYHQSKTKMETF